jgi:hypothetical protein
MPAFVDGAWVWRVPSAGPSVPSVLGVPLAPCRVAAAAPAHVADPLAMARCVLFAAGRP